MSDLEIINKCKAREQQGFRELVNKFSSRMMGIGVRYLKSNEAAQDALQESFIRIFKSVENLKEDGNLGGWICKIMVNECLKSIKKNVIFDELDDFKLNYDTLRVKASDHDLHVEDIIDCLNQLPDHYRIIFNLYEVEGYAHKEISKMLDITESTSRTKLMRAKEKLKFFFQENDLKTDQKINVTYE